MKNVTNYFILIIFLISLVILKPTNEVEATFKLNHSLNINEDIVYTEQKEEVEVLENVEPCRLRSIEDLKGKKIIAFTFDDGPNNATTLKLIEGLQQYDARVTFFVLGSRVEKHRDSLIRAYETCNQIGNHTYSHLNLLKQKEKVITNEIVNTNNAIYNIIGEYPTLIRPPYGNTNKKIKSIGNMPTILWNIDTLDWKYRNSERIANEIINNAEDGAIVLLHDIYPTSVEGALMAMEALKEEYVFVTIEEMMILKNIQIDITKSYYKFK